MGFQPMHLEKTPKAHGLPFAPKCGCSGLRRPGTVHGLEAHATQEETWPSLIVPRWIIVRITGSSHRPRRVQCAGLGAASVASPSSSARGFFLLPVSFLTTK